MDLLLVATLSLAAGAGAPPPPSVLSVAEELAARVGAPAEGRRALALTLEAPAPALARAAEAALAGALASRGFAVSPLRGDPDPEGRARADGVDWILRVQAGLAPGRPEIDRRGEAAFPVRGGRRDARRPRRLSGSRTARAAATAARPLTGTESRREPLWARFKSGQ